MFIVYLLELLTWQKDDYKVQQVLDDLWPHAKRAAQWHMNMTVNNTFPEHMVDTYDVLGLNQYPHDAYSGAFHLLAMRAAETLAYWMGMFLNVCLELKVYPIVVSPAGSLVLKLPSFFSVAKQLGSLGMRVHVRNWQVHLPLADVKVLILHAPLATNSVLALKCCCRSGEAVTHTSESDSKHLRRFTCTCI